MGVIFVAYQKTLKRQIAVKILPKSLLTRSSAELFQQEAESAAFLSHPNIVPIYEVGETEEFLYFTMQLIQGMSLSQIIRRIKQHPLPSRRVFPLKEAIKTLLSVLDGLDFAHQHEIVHRDIKPANILIEAQTHRPIITDFGVAKVMRGPDVSTREILGTPIYMAPEQIVAGAVDGRADIYAVGVMLFELLAMELPIPSYGTVKELITMKALLKDQLFQKKPSDVNPSIHPDMDKIVFKALAYAPDNRYASCRDFIHDLKSYRALHLEQRSS